MADSDEITEKPLYVSEHTRGYFISNATHVFRPSATTHLYSTQIYEDLYHVSQRSVYSTNDNTPGWTISRISLRDASTTNIVRNLYTVGVADGVYCGGQKTNSETYYYLKTPYGIFDTVMGGGKETIAITHGGLVKKYEFANQESRLGKYAANAFTAHYKAPFDLSFKLSYAKSRNALKLLVYPMASSSASMNSVSIELVNHTITEI